MTNYEQDLYNYLTSLLKIETLKKEEAELLAKITELESKKDTFTLAENINKSKIEKKYHTPMYVYEH